MYIKYRLPLFQKLAKIFNITFFFDEIDSKTTVQNKDFNFKVLKSILILKTGLDHHTLSPTLFYHLVRGKYDFIIGTNIGHVGTHIAFLVSRLTHKPFILWDEVWYWPRTFLRILIWPFVKFMLSQSNAIVVPGSKAKEFFVSLHVDPDKIFVAPNASICVLDKSITVKKEEMEERLGIQDKKVVLYFGRLIRRKGLSYLIEAFSKLQEEISDSFLLIAGEGEIREELEKLLTHKMNNILFTGFINEKEKAFYYSIADIVVLPSIRAGHEVEVWGLVLNEAMSVGKPVIATTAVGAAYDLIENGINGCIVNEGDVQSLYEALKEMLSDPRKLEEMGTESKKIIEESFTYDHMTQGFVETIQHITNSLNETKR